MIGDSTLRKVNFVMALISLTLGIGLLGVGGTLAWRHYSFVSHSLEATGTVVENRQEAFTASSNHRHASGHQTYRAIVSFSDKDGHVFRVPDQFAMNPPVYALGATVEMFYDPTDPQNAIVDRKKKAWLVPGVMALVGSLCLLGGFQRLTARISMGVYNQ